MSKAAGVSFEILRDVAVLTLHNPPVNGLGKAVRSGLIAGLEKAHGAPGVKAVVSTPLAHARVACAHLLDTKSPQLVHARACGTMCVQESAHRAPGAWRVQPHTSNA